MKVLVISDTHLKGGEIPPGLKDLIDKYDMVIHAGDFTTPECYRAFNDTGKLKSVHGNSDTDELKDLLPETLHLDLDGISVGVVHEAALSINDTTALRYKALEMGVNVLIFGHIHRPLIEKTDVMVLCPGSPTSPRMSDPMAAELNIEKGEVKARFIEIKGKSCGFVGFTRELENADN
ncbi:metallophosphoesterase [Methanohalophilus mahii]|uniref:Phosphoesterase n=1 Tax=Methanohalophilus mahii (strain ATCC 35705 / DSM 5219 / SLP) TaxID=547558 RepID=D5E7M8_METMS|nr:metallophosphoesterase [Methanohalophilus mahii]ADE37166.1 phosphodiesterase, MJ0936 family [Methanohalophilus mahii DSM 5219]